MNNDFIKTLEAEVMRLSGEIQDLESKIAGLKNHEAVLSKTLEFYRVESNKTAVPVAAKVVKEGAKRGPKPGSKKASAKTPPAKPSNSQAKRGRPRKFAIAAPSTMNSEIPAPRLSKTPDSSKGASSAIVE
jgi:hypothetical protein